MSDSASKDFNPYHKWLGIPLSEQPPTHYRLLGLEALEDDADVIDGAADRCMSFVQQFANGPQVEVSQKILNELSQARVCLLNPELKAQYDQRLQQKLAIQSQRQQPAAPRQASETDHAVAQLGRATSRNSRLTRRKKSSIPMLIGGLVSAGIFVAAISWFLNKDKQDDPDSKDVAAKTESEIRQDNGKSKSKRQTKSTPRVAKTDSSGKQPTIKPPTIETPKFDMPPTLPSGLMAMSPEWLEPEPSAKTLAAIEGIKKGFEEDTTFFQLVEIVFQPTSSSTAINTSLEQLISGYGTQPSVKKLLLLFAKQDWPTAKIARKSVIEFLFKESNDDVWALAKAKALQPTEQLDLRVQAATLLLTQTSNEADIHTIANYLLFGPNHPTELRQLSLEFYFHHQPADLRPRSLAMRVLASREKPIRELAPVAARYLYERHPKDSAAIGTARKITDQPDEWPDELVALSQKFLDGDLPAVGPLPNTPTVSVDPPDPKLPKVLADVPDDTSVVEAKKQLRQVYKQQFVEAKTPKQKLSLSKYLAGRANRIKEPDVDRYVLLRESLELAVDVVAVNEAMQAIDALAGSYKIKPVAEKSQALVQLAPKMRTAAANSAMIQLLFETVDEAIAIDDFDSAGRLQTVASAAARKLRDRELTQQVNTLRTKVSELQRDFRANEEAMATLEADPDDADANLVRAKYLCVVKGDWDAGLKFAVKSGNDSLKALAERDLDRPDAAEDVVALADDYWKLASDRRARLDWLMPSAVYWYKRAVADLTGLDRDQVDERLKSLGKLTVVRSSRSSGVSGVGLTPQSQSQAEALNRRAAAWLVQSGRATIRMADGSTDSIDGRSRLPQGAFVVTGAKIGGNLLEGKTAKDLDDEFKNLSGLTFLESIEIGSSVNVTSAGIEYLAASINLKQFISKSTTLDDDAISVLENMPQLEQLRVDGSQVTDAGLDVVQRIPKLRVLSLSGCQITDAGMFKLRRLTSLEHLILTDTNLTGEGLSHLALLGSLRQLELKDTGLTDQFAVRLRTLSSLRQLNVSDTNITDAAISSFPVEITNLNLEGTAITDQGLASLSRLQELTNLNLDSTKITGQGLRSLTSLPQLSTLSMRGVALVDAHASTFSQLPSLQTLFLNHTMITDVGLTRLSTANKLTNLYVGNTQVTDDGIANFKMMRPDCTVSGVELLLDP